MKGSFACDDDFYNELWKRSARTLYITMRDNYMDCLIVSVLNGGEMK